MLDEGHARDHHNFTDPLKEAIRGKARITFFSAINLLIEPDSKFCYPLLAGTLTLNTARILERRYQNINLRNGVWSGNHWGQWLMDLEFVE